MVVCVDTKATQAARFESSHMLGALLASTSLISDAWTQCAAANVAAPGGFVADLVGDVAFVAFSGVQLVSADCFAQVPIVAGNDLFSAVAEHGGEAATVSAGFLRMYLALYQSPDFHNKITAAMSGNKAVVFAGHSLGGALAALAALSVLSSPAAAAARSLFCVTFGSPFIGNKALSAAITDRGWAHRFCHVTSIHDMVPRLFLSALPGSLWPTLDRLFRFWHSRMRPSAPFLTDGPDLPLSEPDAVHLHRFISALVSGREEEWGPYRPFGNFLFCSTDGAICIDDPTATIQLLQILMGPPGSGIVDHLAYGDRAARISQHFLLRGRSDRRDGNGMSLALEALGAHRDPLKMGPTKECLAMAAKRGLHPNLNSAGLAIRLARVTPCRAQVEWYKAYCDNRGLSYYDSFRLRLAPKRDSAVNMARFKLGNFWDRVIEMVQSNQLPCDFPRRAKFVNASHFYTLMVEPLEIAEYYRTGKHRTQGHYLVAGRQKRFQVFDKWWQQRTLGIASQRKRRALAGWTQDSCFWAKVEEANEWTESLRKEKDGVAQAELWKKLVVFEEYAKNLVERKEVSKDVLAEESSYSSWVKELEALKRELPFGVPFQG
ncbi:hypothetical protein H6P81_017982 [Aristolochia fimbriata]|uniref:Lipase-like PAD4 n=1 Tax=Aristolochia fimbriata TaxID=158543 RepID=A0AAV7E404_ARIFI|nr:hypothetical protein H6P81_017982 [Aristolochia fimbriata]